MSESTITRNAGREHVSHLFRTRRHCVYIPLEGYVEGHGWRPSFVFENESGHYPNGNWPYTGKPGETVPWFWGHDYDTACKIADEFNSRLGVTPQQALEIVTSSLAMSREPRGARG